MITLNDLDNIGNALRSDIITEEEKKSIDKFYEMMDETIDWLDNDPEVIELMNMIDSM